MSRPPLNYTTKIAANRTANECMALLGEAGAAAVSLEWANREPVRLSFRFDGGATGPANFRMPVNIDGVAKLLRNADYPASVKREERIRYTTREHAARVAWRVMRDWLEAQLTRVAANMAGLDEVMFAYMEVGPGETLYERFIETHGRLELTDG